jgi:hypothetical protein
MGRVRERFLSGWVKGKMDRDTTLLQDRALTAFSSSTTPGRTYEIGGVKQVGMECGKE